jgi:hypothetical protein
MTQRSYVYIFFKRQVANQDDEPVGDGTLGCQVRGLAALAQRIFCTGGTEARAQ